MAYVTVRTIVQNASLNPGQSRHWWWNNARQGRVYVLELIPLPIGDYYSGYNHTSVGEITRQWRRYRTWEVPGSIGVTVRSELEIHFVVKNIGNKKLRYSVKMAEIF